MVREKPQVDGTGLVVVTGGAGFIGSNLVRRLLKVGYRVRVLDDFSVGSAAAIEFPGVDIVEGSVLRPRELRGVFSDCVGVVHLAAQTGVPLSLKNPKRDCRYNVMGTLNVLEEIRQSCGGRPPRFVFSSSNAPLGRQPPPAEETKAPLPISPYGASKLAGEAYCLAYFGSWAMPTVVLRFGNVYGPFSAHKQSVVAAFMKRVLSGGELKVDGNGHQTRDFVFVGDLCDAVIAGLESDAAGEVFQVATGVQTTIAELVTKIVEVSGGRVAVSKGPARQGDIEHNYSSVDKSRRVLGWEPRTDLETGLRDTWEWFAGHVAKGGMAGSEHS